MSKSQTTIQKAVSLSGVGLHTGQTVNMTFRPAAANSGYVFQRTDLEGAPLVEALASHVVNTDRGTTIAKGDAKIHTVEHVLAALVGLGIDNCLIELDSAEPPIMDGSSKDFVAVLEQAGIETLPEERDELVIREVIEFHDPESGVELLALPANEYQITVMVDYGTKVLGSQNAHLEHMSDFKEEIAKARTFSFLHELEFMLDNGLIQGGDLNNAIVYVDKEPSSASMDKLRKAFKKEKVSVKPNGILDNLDLHYTNEAARHKLLDVVGDLALVGKPIRGRIVATKPGHTGNTKFAKLLMDRARKDPMLSPPDYDPNAAPRMTVEQIMAMLPHRPPFLLVDKILEISDQHVVGVKNVTMNESFFVGHFPGAPVMPGVLQVEAMAQVGGILALSTVPDPENYLTFFLKMDGVRFKQKVVPGDTLVFRLYLTAPIRRGIVQMKGQAFVGSKLVCEAELMAQISKER